jgi:hypothetical protein
MREINSVRTRKKPPAWLVPLEAEEMQIVVDWLTAAGVFFLHPRNEGRPTSRNQLGIRPGAPDLFIYDRPLNRPMCPGAVIELKRRKGGRVRPEQRLCLALLKERGWECAVCRGADEAIAFLEELGYRIKGKRQ